MVEYTLTIYLFGFAIGTLFWGKLSDKFGRKPCILAGLVIFSLGCMGCYFSSSIEMLMISRLIQAFGGSIGSVLGQAVCRDAFHGPSLGKAYASIGSALALFPSLGPVIGGVIAENFGWSSIFLFLTGFTLILIAMVSIKLPETLPANNRKKTAILEVALSLMQDKRVIGLGCIVAACNGILFSYFAEGSFYFIDLLGLSPSMYGASFIMIGIATMLGGVFSKRLHNNQHSSTAIIKYGLAIMGFSAALFSMIAAFHHHILQLDTSVMVTISIVSQMCLSFGICMATSNALALALTDYKHCIGTASSLFGFFYYCLISLFTLGMGMLHNGTLLPMPLYFLTLSIFMLIVQKLMLRTDTA